MKTNSEQGAARIALDEGRLWWKVLDQHGRNVPMGGAKQTQYRLPRGNVQGAWMPVVDAVMCHSGYHLCSRPIAWLGCRVFLAEGRDLGAYSMGNAVFQTVRLLAEVNPSNCIDASIMARALYPFMSYADLSYANLDGANLYGADLNHANLSYADLDGANLSRADLSYADLSYADLSYANLDGANLDGADLNHANLSYANLSHADLDGANLSRADLSYADLDGADLSYADLNGANLNGANLNGAKGVRKNENQ